jgi:hypothetical protein
MLSVHVWGIGWRKIMAGTSGNPSMPASPDYSIDYQKVCDGIAIPR